MWIRPLIVGNGSLVVVDFAEVLYETQNKTEQGSS